MIVHAHPTDADYKHALAAHATWPQFAPKAEGWHRHLPLFWMMCLGIPVILGLAPEFLSSREWTVNGTSLLIAVLFYPFAALILGFYATLLTSYALRRKPTGIIERNISPKGKHRAVMSSQTLLGWIVFFVLAVAIFAFTILRSSTTGQNGPAPATPTGSTSQGAIDSPWHVSGSAVFAGSVIVWIVVLIFTAKLQKGRQAKSLLNATPALLLPRTWEATEDWISERGELLQTTMKWEYLRKFMETPTVIMLYPNEQTFYLIPKTAFVSELELAEFMGLLMRKLPNGVMQPRGGRGFLVQPVAAIPLSNGGHL